MAYGAPFAAALAAAGWLIGWPDQGAAYGPFLPPAIRLDGNSAKLLQQAFLRFDYDLDAIGAGRGDVPRIILARLPPDLDKLTATETRKRLFLSTMLPLVLQVNEEIAARRRRLLAIMATDDRPSPDDLAWLQEMAQAYGVADPAPPILLPRIDQVPPSLALAQAAEETGWGTSRFARDGNALFGQWSFGTEGVMRPLAAVNDGYGIRSFDNLVGAVRAYAHNLNTHAAYREFRVARTAMRRAGQPLDGDALAGSLSRYSERGSAYVRSIRAIMRDNGLAALDAARFAGIDPDPAPLHHRSR